MRLFTVTALAVALLASSNVVCAFQQEQATIANVDAPVLDDSIATVQYDNVAKRSLRTHEALDESDEGEERGLNLKFWMWLKKGMDPKKMYAKLGLDGLGENAWKHPKYKTYLAFSKYWRENH